MMMMMMISVTWRPGDETCGSAPGAAGATTSPIVDGSQREQQPPEPSQSTPFAKLSDLTSFHLGHSAAGGAVGKPSALAIPKLNIPFGQKSTAASLTSANASPVFRIPKLSLKATEPGPEATPHAMSLRKIMDLQKITLADSATAPLPLRPSAPSILVNLTAAASAQVLRPSAAKRKPSDTETASMDIDTIVCHPCDEPPAAALSRQRGAANPTVSTSALRHALRDNLTVECRLDASALARLKLPGKTTRRSRLGRTLCARFANAVAMATAAVGVRHEFARGKHAIKAYAFEKPSPDDVILRQLAKWKK